MIDLVDAALEGLITVPELLGFTEASGDRLHDAALALFERGAVPHAEGILGWLVEAKPYVGRYWRSYGATLQVREAFIEASRAYTTALAIDPEDLVARAHRGECLLMVGLAERGVEDLRRAASATDAGALTPWVENAARLLRLHQEALDITNDERTNS